MVAGELPVSWLVGLVAGAVELVVEFALVTEGLAEL